MSQRFMLLSSGSHFPQGTITPLVMIRDAQERSEDEGEDVAQESFKRVREEAANAARRSGTISAQATSSILRSRR